MTNDSSRDGTFSPTPAEGGAVPNEAAGSSADLTRRRERTDSAPIVSIEDIPSAPSERVQRTSSDPPAPLALRLRLHPKPRGMESRPPPADGSRMPYFPPPGSNSTTNGSVPPVRSPSLLPFIEGQRPVPSRPVAAARPQTQASSSGQEPPPAPRQVQPSLAQPPA